LGRRTGQELGSSIEESGNPTTQTSTPKSVEEVVVEVMKVDKLVELFQTMAIMRLNILKNRLAPWEKEKAMLQEELDKHINS
jgi:hypothetical protein